MRNKIRIFLIIAVCAGFVGLFLSINQQDTLTPQEATQGAVPSKNEHLPPKITEPIYPKNACLPTTCGAGCTHAVTDSISKTETPDKKITEAIQTKLFALHKGSDFLMELPNGDEAMGLVDLIQKTDNQTVLVQGSLTHPAQGRFFFRRQMMPGKTAMMVGVMTFVEGDVAYRIEEASDGSLVLREKQASDVFCHAYAALDQQAMPMDHPSDVGIPGSQNSIIPLSSLPHATAVVYLDFDGEEGPHEGWGDFYAEPFLLSTEEIKTMWAKVAEAYAAFNINVTTDLGIFLAAPENSRARCIITPTRTAHPMAGGVALTGSFNWEGDVPCWCFATGEIGALTATHEIGHTLGLSHDGTPTSEYFSYHGSGAMKWGPIMGAPFRAKIQQWCKGEYANANNQEDDIAIISMFNNGVSIRIDDHGDQWSTASFLDIDPSNLITNKGVIASETDIDTFQFTLTESGQVSLNIQPAIPGAKLNIAAQISDQNGTIYFSSPIDETLDATIAQTLSSGTYFLHVSGTGYGDIINTGFSEYASIGFYTISGSITHAVKPDRFSVYENTPISTVIGTLLPRTDHGNHSLQYSIVSGNTNQLFSINATTGVITLSGALDYESFNPYYDQCACVECEVEIADITAPEQTERIRVVIKILNANESPTLLLENTSYTLLEHTEIGTSICTLSGTDPDPYDFTSYAITAGNTDQAFNIDIDSGVLTVTADLSVNHATSYTLTLQVSDRGTPPLTASTNLTITLVDIEEGYTPGSFFSTCYDDITGDTVASLTAHPHFPYRPDFIEKMSSTDASTYGENYGRVFRAYLIPPASGNYTFWIAASDAGNVLLSTNADPANATPICSTSQPTAPHQWDLNPEQQSSVMTLQAGQPYYFEIRQKSAVSSDHLSVAWQGPNLSQQIISALYTAPFDINFSPKITPQTMDLFAGSYAGTLVTTVEASDLNPDDTLYPFTIINGNTDGAFAIDPHSGLITVAKNSLFSNGDTYSLHVQISDQRTPPRSHQEIITIHLRDTPSLLADLMVKEVWNNINGLAVSDLTNHPNYPDAPSYRSRLRDFFTGFSLENHLGTRIRAYVIPPLTGNYTFFISSDDQSQLWLSSDEDPANAQLIASVNGQTYLSEWEKDPSQRSAPIMLTAGNRYYIESIHKEHHLYDHCEVGWITPENLPIRIIRRLFLEGLNLNTPPQWPQTPFSFVASNEDTPNSIAGTLTATDSSSDALTYTILSGNDQNAFSIDPATGIIRTPTPSTLLEGEQILVVGVQDLGDNGLFPPASTTTQISITITGGQAPNASDATFSLAENQVAGTLIGTVQATDASPNDQLKYVIIQGNSTGAFIIDTTNGDLFTTQPLDYETSPNHLLTIKVTDLGGLADTATITLQIQDQQENENDGLSGYWKLDEQTGTTAYDTSTNHLDMDFVGDTLLGQTGKIDDAFYFNGINSAIITQNTPIPTTQELTITAWIHPENLSGKQGILDKKEVFIFQTYGEKLRMRTYPTHKMDSVNCLTTHQWQFVTVTLEDQGSCTFYINGQFKSSTSSRTFNLNANSIKIGTTQNNYRFNGKIDDVRLYHRILTAAEIEALYQQTQTDYTQWKTEVFSPSDLSNPAISGDTADVDNDQLSTLIEYALGLDPKNGESITSSLAILNEGSNPIRFKRYPSHKEVDLVLEWKSKLTDSTWQPIAQSIGGNVIEPLNGATLLSETGAEPTTVQILPPTFINSYYLRWKVTRR